MNTLIYTVNFGQYDSIPIENFYSNKIRYICFYNGEIKKRGNWEYVKINSKVTDYKRLSRDYKINFFKYLPEHKNSIYIDCNRVITEKLINYSLKLFKNYSFGVLKHSVRKTLVDELIDWYLISICSEEEIIKIGEYLKKIKYDFEKHYCPHCCLLLRENNNKNINFSKLWWKNFLKFNKRDQLPFTLSSIALKYYPFLIEKEKLIITRKHLKTYKKKIRSLKKLEYLIHKLNDLFGKKIEFNSKNLEWRDFTRKQINIHSY